MFATTLKQMPLKDQFDLTLIFGLGIHYKMTPAAIMDYIVGPQFVATISNRMLVRGINDETFEVIVLGTKLEQTPLVRKFVGEEKVFLYGLAKEQFDHWMTKQDVENLKKEIADLKAKMNN